MAAGMVLSQRPLGTFSGWAGGGGGTKFFEEGVYYDTGEGIILEIGLPDFGLYGFCTHAYILLLADGILTDTRQTPTAKTVKDMNCLFFIFLALPLGRVFTVSGRGTGDGGAKVREKEMMMMEEVDRRARGVGVSAQALAH